MFLLDFSVEAQTKFLEWVVAGGLEVDQETMADAPRIIEIMRKHADLPADFVRCIARRPMRATPYHVRGHDRQALRYLPHLGA
jgi:hypothetical protein